MEKYFNDAIIGNKNLTASYTNKGELIRLFYPTTDYRQFIDFLHVGVKINDSGIIYLHDDINNTYSQYYTKNTNILNTEIINTYFKLKIIQADFVCIKENVLVKKYKFKNENNINLKLNLLTHSKLITTDNNQVSGYCTNDSLIQYMHDYSICMFTKNKILNSQINNTIANINEGIINDKDYIGMSSDSSISYDIGELKPNEEKEIELYIYIDENKNNLDGIEREIDRIKKIDFKTELDKTEKYWIKYFKEHDSIELNLPKTPRTRKIREIYERTILLYPLLTNSETGGISAAVEIDEKLTKCGRYTYCWPRDAVFITKAMDILKMNKETEKFYKIFCRNTQSRNGMWEQRFYTDCRLAPCWGYQIDETASVVFGVYDHFIKTKDIKFLKDTLKMCEKAIKFLHQYVESILSNNITIQKSYDLWEMYEGIHLYSMSSIFAAYRSMIEIYKQLKEEFDKNRVKKEKVVKKIELLEKQSIQIKEFILNNFYNEDRKCFVRNLEDKKIDISILGATVPFNVFVPNEKKMLNTVETMNLTIRTYTGGYQRFESDHYMGGNPWVIATLWMANYYIEIKEYKKAKECFNFVVKTSAKHGFLPEQISNETLKPAWIIGLGWSHAMYIIVLEKMVKLKII